MCGIAGVYWKNKRPHHWQSAHTGTLLSKALEHRGPDDHGVISCSETMDLVHTRLSIIDVGGGHQPLIDKESSVFLVGNGEIYNYRELKDLYPHYAYTSESDMESVFPLYRAYGQGFASSLRGMFALALYDQNQNSLLLSRDPYGIKPLYYAEDGEKVVFASEPQALFKAGLWIPRVQKDARDEVLNLRYATGQHTPFQGIKRVSPGETMVFQHHHCYKAPRQDPLCRPTSCGTTSYGKISTQAQALKALDTALRDSIRVHLRSHVPYGLFLSGGIDSAVILKLMHQETGKPIRSWTLGFEGKDVHDERAMAGRLAHSVGALHEEILFTEKDFWTSLPSVVACLDDLNLDQATLPTYALAQVASKEVKVVLCGEGGDELFGGYRRYQKASWPAWMGGRLFRQKGTFQKQDALFNPPLDSQWYERLKTLCLQEKEKNFTPLQQAQALDCGTWLPNGLLLKLDRCLMAHGVEGRTPFLDPQVTAQAFFLKDSWKWRWGYGKWLLRQWLHENFPESSPFAKKKGFRVPVERWLMDHKKALAQMVAMQDGIQELCTSSENVRDFFTSLTSENAFGAWTLLVYALWYKHHIQGVCLKGIPTFEALNLKT